MNKSKLFLLTAVLLLSLLFCAAFGCGGNKDEGEKAGAGGSLYYKPPAYADKIYTVNADSMSTAELVAAESLQGILAQDAATVCILDKNFSRDDAAEVALRSGLSVEHISDVWTLINKFSDKISGQKYVLYNLIGEDGTSVTDQTINYAATVAGAEKYLMVSKTLEQKAVKEGFSLGKDVTNSSTRTIFTEYKDRLNKSYLVHQDPAMPYLRDYAIAGRAMCFYSDYYDGDSNVKMDILAWADENAPILGWTANELNFVSSNSLMSKITIAADWATNLSFTAAATRTKIQQKNYQQRTITPEKGKHYVAVVMSDGDNVQWMTGDFESNTKYYGSDYRGAFPMTWTTSPSLYDLAPDTLNSLYNSATASDQFIAGPSGVGYVNGAEYNTDSLDGYAGYTAGYMEKTDIEYVNFLDNSCEPEMLETFARYKQIKGGIWSVGNKYIEGYGDLYWANDKPFVAVRDTLWRIPGDDYSNKYYGFVERVAQRINSYKRDYTAIEGYTVVMAHAWSIGSMDYINRFVADLDDDVVLVTVGEMLDMISKNVPHKNAKINDIQPDDIADADLVPISSEQYDWKRIKDTPVSTDREFVFSGSEIAAKWQYGTGGLQYDKAVWVESNTIGGPSIMLDGSDLDDVIDPMPNSWMYARFDLSNSTDKDNYLVLEACGGTNADVNMRVRALYEENGKMKSVTLTSDNYDKTLDEYGWFRRDSSSSPMFVYDLKNLKGNKVIISIEQDDTGDGSGEILYISRIGIVGEIPPEQELDKWNAKEIFYYWKRSGNVERHKEGVCLEARLTNAEIYKDISVTDNAKYIKFYVRMFVREEALDTPPQLSLYCSDTLIRAENASSDTVSVIGDEYRCFVYDLSAYLGETVTVKFTSISGDHAAIGKIILSDSYALSELTNEYTDTEINEL